MAQTTWGFDTSNGPPARQGSMFLDPAPGTRASGTRTLSLPFLRDSSARNASTWLGSEVSSEVMSPRCSPAVRCS